MVYIHGVPPLAETLGADSEAEIGERWDAAKEPDGGEDEESAGKAMVAGGGVFSEIACNRREAASDDGDEDNGEEEGDPDGGDPDLGEPGLYDPEAAGSGIGMEGGEMMMVDGDEEDAGDCEEEVFFSPGLSGPVEWLFFSDEPDEVDKDPDEELVREEAEDEVLTLIEDGAVKNGGRLLVGGVSAGAIADDETDRGNDLSTLGASPTTMWE